MTNPARLLLAPFAALVLAAPAAAQVEDLAQSSRPPDRFSILIAYGDEPCPEATGDEIVVCARHPDSDRYRVPVELREGLKDDALAGGGSWASAVEAHDDVARLGRPNSCSVVGSNGFSGCTSAMLRQWFAERRQSR